MSIRPDDTVRRRDLFAWALYDWANSAYSTISITLLVAYLQQVVLPQAQYGVLGAVVWAWGISLSMLTAAILSPIVGAMADARAAKRRYLAVTALLGSGSAILLALVPPTMPWAIVALFLSASLWFELSLGFYNGFLPEIADGPSMNRVSAWGYGLGYVGGGLALLAAVLLMQLAPRLGIDELADQLRMGLMLMGIWWAVFTIPTVVILRDRAQPTSAPMPLARAARHAAGKVGHTLSHLRTYRALALFLLGFLLFNDGIQTVISQSSTFALMELDFNTNDLVGLILMVQFVASPGALLIGWVADRWGQKRTLLFCLGVWIGLLVYSFFITSKSQFWAMGIVLALVLGGTQSVSRAIMGRMTPREHTAEFFGFFNLSGKATSFLGTFVFGLMISLSGSPRIAILSLLVFFVAGALLIARVDIARGAQAARGRSERAANE